MTNLGGSPMADEAKAAKAEKDAKDKAKPTTYTVLYRTGDEGYGVHPDTVSAVGQETALRAAAQLSGISEAAHNGGVEIALVPARSFDPKRVGLVQRDPVLKVGV